MTRKTRMEKALIQIRRGMDVIERVESRCAAADGPVTPTVDEIRQEELGDIHDCLWRAEQQLADVS